MLTRHTMKNKRLTGVGQWIIIWLACDERLANLAPHCSPSSGGLGFGRWLCIFSWQSLAFPIDATNFQNSRPQFGDNLASPKFFWEDLFEWWSGLALAQSGTSKMVIGCVTAVVDLHRSAIRLAVVCCKEASEFIKRWAWFERKHRFLGSWTMMLCSRWARF